MDKEAERRGSRKREESQRKKEGKESKRSGRGGVRRRKVGASAHLHKQSLEAQGGQGPCKMAHQI